MNRESSTGPDKRSDTESTSTNNPENKAEYHPGSPLSPELFQKIYFLLNEGHRIDFASATSLEKVRELIDQQIRQHQTRVDLFKQAFEPAARRENQEEKAQALLGKLDSNLSPAMAESLRKRIASEQEKIDVLQVHLTELQNL